MKVFEYNILASTQDEAKKRIAEEKESFAVFAEIQSAGYGKQGREWLSTEGNYSATFVIPEPKELKLGTLLWWLTVMVCESLEKKLAIPLDIKWPNDVLLKGKKICGMLVERVENRLVIGIGVNLKEAPPVQNRVYKVTSVFDECGAIVEPKDLFVAHYARFKSMAGELSDCARLYESYCDRLFLLHRSIRIKAGLEIVEGIFKGVTPEGALVLDVGGQDRIFFSAEIEREEENAVPK